jgi:hypothetical protein
MQSTHSVGVRSFFVSSASSSPGRDKIVLHKLQVYSGGQPASHAKCKMVRGKFPVLNSLNDRLCGLVVRAPGYRSRDLGSIPGATGFSE